jgi:hypothetical protein
MQDAIEDKFIEVLVDEHTNLLTDNVLTVLEYLFYNYRKVYSEEVLQYKVEVISMI